MKITLAILALSLTLSPSKDAVRGSYIEARTCDVWTGPCFSNSEENTTGEMAVLGWLASEGQYDGANLSGLGVAAAIRAEGTLGTQGEGKIRAVVFVDERADAAQESALLAVAKKLAGKYLASVVQVEKAKIDFDFTAGKESLAVAKRLGVSTQPLTHCDKHCGNEVPAYPSLARTQKSSCAKTVEHFFRGDGLGARWSDPWKRSAIVGTFSL